MKVFTISMLAVIGLTMLSCSENKKEIIQPIAKVMPYPTTDKDSIVDKYFDTLITDPYRWLEDDKSDKTAKWVDDQNIVTQDFLKQIPFREAYKARLEKLWNFEKYSAPFIEGEYTYFYKNDGLQNQSVLWRSKGSAAPEVFLDPNSFSKDGTTSLAGINFSKDGSKVAYQISEGGSDWTKIIVLNTADKKVIEDTIVDIKFSNVSWLGNEGFYYSSYEKPKGSKLSAKTDQHKVYFHTLGTKQSTDRIVFGDKIKRRYIGTYVTEDNRYLIITAANATSGNELYMIDLMDKNGKITTIQNNMNSDTYVLDNVGSMLYLVTNADAPNQKIVTVDAANSGPENWKVLIPETENVLEPTTGGGYIFAHYMKDALSVIKQYDYQGKLVKELTLPGLGTASLSGAKKDAKEMYFSFTNYINPTTIYKFDPKNGSSSVYKKPTIDYDPSQYESKQVFYTSKDGTKVPMLISYKKGMKLDGTNATILYGYGGFNVSLTPAFSISNAVWMEQGGIFAVPNIRGGGEYGKKWHDAGTQNKKQNVFDDFIAAAEYLIAQKYTSTENLAISGGSNGGLLVGAAMTQRPELFKVALPAVGVLDMLRYHTFTAGAGWAYDYGTSDQSPEMFTYLLGYSPVHNVRQTKYPATLVTTADHDDRVVPAHSFKFIAELQAKQQGNNPVLIRIDKSAGHGAGKPTTKIIEEAADKACFTLYNMGKSIDLKLKN